MDAIDRQLLESLQSDSTISHADLAQRVKLSATGVFKRLKRLEAQGFIKKYMAILSRETLGLDLLCFLTVSFKTNVELENLRGLTQAVEHLPQVLECFTTTGSQDAILKVAVRDHKELRAFLREFSNRQNVVERIETRIVLEEVKENQELPLGGFAEVAS